MDPSSKPRESKSFREIVREIVEEACTEQPNESINSTRMATFVDRIFDSFHLEAGINVTRWVTLNKELQTERQRNEKLVEALRGALAEASTHLRMYVQSYKREPYDTGVMLEQYLRDSNDRMNRYEQALAENKEQV